MARAPALQAGGHRFDSDILHQNGRSPFKDISPVEDRWRSEAGEEISSFITTDVIRFREEGGAIGSSPSHLQPAACRGSKGSSLTYWE